MKNCILTWQNIRKPVVSVFVNPELNSHLISVRITQKKQMFYTIVSYFAYVVQKMKWSISI